METFERTWGARLNNAGKLVTYLQSFTNYSPPNVEQSPTSLQQMVDEIAAHNKFHAGNEQLYSAATDSRVRCFQNDSGSVIRILTPVLAAVRAGFGKNSKEAANITAKAVKIRGTKLAKASSDDEKTISRSQRSFGSVTQHFADMLAIIELLGGNYKPANNDISIGALRTKLASMNQLNTAVNKAFAKVKESGDYRRALYQNLSSLTQHIKEAVKSQYGYKSTEYALVKGLVI